MRQGHAEIMRYGQWWPICGDSHSLTAIDAANVTCYHLGYPGVVMVTTAKMASYDQTFWPICKGNESIIDDCLIEKAKTQACVALEIVCSSGMERFIVILR